MNAWTRHLETLTSYYQEQGSLRGLSAQHRQTANWLARQRHADLAPEQRAQLEAIPGALDGGDRGVPAFLEAFALWLQDDPKRTAKHLRYTTTRTVAGQVIPLGRRAAYIRQRHEQGLLSPADVDALNQHPGLLQPAPRAQVQRFVDAVKLWLAEDDSRAVSNLTWNAQQLLDGKQINIGRMASYFRTAYADGTLSANDIATIETSIPGWTWEHRSAPRRVRHTAP